MVDKAPALAEIVDVLIHQYAGVKSRLIMLRKCPMNRIPQQSCQEAGSVIVLSPRHDAGKLHSQPAFRSDLNRDRKTGVTTYFGNLTHGAAALPLRTVGAGWLRPPRSGQPLKESSCYGN